MLKNDYMTIAEASDRWGISQRQVQHLCTLGSVEGAVKFGRAWMIPKIANKPVDGRTKAARTELDADMPLPRKTPFLYMSDLYNTPGTADEVGASLSYHHEAQVLFEAEVAYSRGEIDKVYDIAKKFTKWQKSITPRHSNILSQTLICYIIIYLTENIPQKRCVSSIKIPNFAICRKSRLHKQEKQLKYV